MSNKYFMYEYIRDKVGCGAIAVTRLVYVPHYITHEQDVTAATKT